MKFKKKEIQGLSMEEDLAEFREGKAAAQNFMYGGCEATD